MGFPIFSSTKHCALWFFRLILKREEVREGRREGGKVLRGGFNQVDSSVFLFFFVFVIL